MNDHVSSLYALAHELLNLGMDGSPIYSDHFARLNREVYEQALNLYNAPEGNTPEEEAELCLSILLALNATFYDNGRKQQFIQHGEVYDEKLASEAHSIIDTWDTSSLTPEQTEIIGELKNMEENQYPFEIVD